MRLYLIRHAIAVPRGTPGIDSDESRPLTPDGIAKMRRHARALGELKVALDEVWTSPLVRARQTAEVLVDVMTPPPACRVVGELAPGGNFDQLMGMLKKSADRRGIGLVGHEPDLGALATHLIAGFANSGVRFKKGGIACIELEDFELPMCGQLLWLLTPRQLAMMA